MSDPNYTTTKQNAPGFSTLQKMFNLLDIKQDYVESESGFKINWQNMYFIQDVISILLFCRNSLLSVSESVYKWHASWIIQWIIAALLTPTVPTTSYCHSHFYTSTSALIVQSHDDRGVCTLIVLGDKMGIETCRAGSLPQGDTSQSAPKGVS